MPSTFSAHQLASDFAPPGVQPHHHPDVLLEPSHLDIDLAIDLDAQSAQGVVTTTVRARTDEARTLRLDAVDFAISDVRDPDGHALSWSYDGLAIAVRWDEPVHRRATRRVAVTYRVERPITGLMFSTADGREDAAGRWAVTDHETERARHWLPCLDHTGVRTTLTFRLRTEEALTVLANGLLVTREEHGDGTATSLWRLDQPCPAYLVCFAIGDFVKVDGGEVGGREIAAFAPRSFGPEPLERSFGGTAAMMEWMQGRLRTAFPYPKYFQFAVPGVGGAMENISLVSWDARFLADEALHAEWGWLIDLINLHEMAHSYFGDAVVCRDFSHTWLKEGWAVYMESVWLGDTQGHDAMAFQLHEERHEYFSEVATRYARPIVTREFASSWDMFDRHLYPGGAVRLHMLQRSLGAEDFWGGVAAYLGRYIGGVVETDDFRRVLEEQSGRSLSRFFDQWLRSPGHPKLKASQAHDADRGELSITVEQTQVDAEAGIGLFDFPLTVAVKSKDGAWSWHAFDISETRHQLTVRLAEPPVQVVLDPNGDLAVTFDYAPGDTMLRAQLAEGPTFSSRLQSADLLSKRATPANCEALVGAWEGAHWGLQVVIARALSLGGTIAAARALAGLVALPQDPRVWEPLLRACGELREPVLADALRTWLARGDGGPRATFAALAALGKQGDDAALHTLVEASRVEGWGDWVMLGATAGLGALRSCGGRAALLEAMAARGARPNMRSARLTALAGSARFGDAEERSVALDRLVDATRDPNYAVRSAAVGALGVLGERAGLAAIEAAKVTFAAQDVPRVDRSIKAIRDAGGANATAKLEGRIEELGAALRAVRDRVDVLEAQRLAVSASASSSKMTLS